LVKTLYNNVIGENNEVIKVIEDETKCRIIKSPLGDLGCMFVKESISSYVFVN